MKRAAKTIFKLVEKCVFLFFAYHALYGAAVPIVALSCDVSQPIPGRLITFWQIAIVGFLYYYLKWRKLYIQDRDRNAGFKAQVKRYSVAKAQ